MREGEERAGRHGAAVAAWAAAARKRGATSASSARPARRLLCKDPKKRPDAREALGHPWLKVTSSKIDGGDAVVQSVSNEVIQNLTIFAASNKLQRAFMHLAVGFMGRSEMQKLLSMFNALNTDRQKPLGASEIKALLCQGRTGDDATRVATTVDVRHPLLVNMLALRPAVWSVCKRSRGAVSVDSRTPNHASTPTATRLTRSAPRAQLVMGSDGELSIEDFVVAAMNQYRNLSDAVIKTMFASLDGDNDGWITAQDAFDALHPAGIPLSVEELARLFDRYGVKRRLGGAKNSSGAHSS